MLMLVPGETEMMGAEPPDIVTLAAVIPHVPVAVTLYVPGCVTAMDGVVCPFDHRYVAPFEAVRIMVSFAQTVEGPVMLTGNPFCMFIGIK